MNSKDLIQLNNEMRKELTKENLKAYEEMLVYIRLNANKSEQQTEETLMELLEHLTSAQEEGKSAQDVFGDDLKEYCDELINEIPGEQKSKSIVFGAYIVIHYLAIISTFYGALSFVMYRFFDVGSSDFTFSLGTGLTTILIDLILLYFYIKVVLMWIKGTSFKKKQTKKWVEFLQIWGITMVFIGLFILIHLVIPSFGTTLSIPVVSFVGIGVLLFLISYTMNRKLRIIK